MNLILILIPSVLQRRKCLFVALLALMLPDSCAYGQDQVDFEQHVRPLLIEHCGKCHGPTTQKSGLRLDARQAAFKGGDNGPVIVPEKSNDSELLQRVKSADPDERMPPDGPPLEPNEIALLQRWIDGGAQWPETDYDRAAAVDPRLQHWAFQPLKPFDVPETGDQAAGVSAPWNEIDHFVIAKLREHALSFNPAADRRTLIRRLALDVTGLPPSFEDVGAFEASDDPHAWASLVEAMLASPRYGERWAQYWLDVIRYADTHGFEVNTPRENSWPYRDYVIQALNEDKPYDQFVREQLAGDVFHADAATGFMVASAVLLPGQIGADDVSKRLARQDALDEIIVGTSGSFLGLTIGCARCHDHKFDPITQQDYYNMQAFFAGVDYGDRPIRDAAASEQTQRAAELVEKIQQPETPRMIYGGIFRDPDKTYLLRRGDPEQPLDETTPLVPGLIKWSAHDRANQLTAASDQPLTSEQQRRLNLANWIASPLNPLTARVMVNRIWQQHFGLGLVDTPNDFGINGVKPSHPELLDWLALEFIDSGWSIKHLHRLILNSATYRQSSQVSPHAVAVDRDNRLLWRFASRRLEAEAVRDCMLSVSGELNLKMSGPGFSFFKTRGGLDGFPPVDDFTAENMRRMIYSHKIRMEPVPVFGAFDCPDAGQATPRRGRSTTAIQALNLFNSPFVLDRADKLATRAIAVASTNGNRPDQIDPQIEQLFRIVLSRDPTSTERQQSRAVVTHHGLVPLSRALLNCSEFLFIP